MGLRFNMLLNDAGIYPAEVRLLRHQTHKEPGRTPYSRWRDDEADFEAYQSQQDGAPRARARFAGRYWASFVAPTPGATIVRAAYEGRLNGPVLGILRKTAAMAVEWRSGRRTLSEYRGRPSNDWGKICRARNGRVGSTRRQARQADHRAAAKA